MPLIPLQLFPMQDRSRTRLTSVTFGIQVRIGLRRNENSSLSDSNPRGREDLVATFPADEGPYAEEAGVMARILPQLALDGRHPVWQSVYRDVTAIGLVALHLPSILDLHFTAHVVPIVVR